MKLLTHGIKTTWAHDAIVYDEKVTTMMASCKQRLRWAQGQFDMVIHQMLPALTIHHQKSIHAYRIYRLSFVFLSRIIKNKTTTHSSPVG